MSNESIQNLFSTHRMSFLSVWTPDFYWFPQSTADPKSHSLLIPTGQHFRSGGTLELRSRTEMEKCFFCYWNSASGTLAPVPYVQEQRFILLYATHKVGKNMNAVCHFIELQWCTIKQRRYYILQWGRKRMRDWESNHFPWMCSLFFYFINLIN